MKLYKGVTLILAGILCFSMAACGGKTKNPDKDYTAPVNPVTDPVEHLYDGGLHKVSVTDSNRPFVTNGTTDYAIVLGNDGKRATEAALFLQKHIEKATGASVPIKKYGNDTPWSAQAKYIVLGSTELFAAAGLSMPSDRLGQTGYHVKTAGNSAFLMTAHDNGYSSAAIAFLRYVIGYEMYAENIVIYDKSGETLPDMDITEKPDFEFHLQSNKVSAEASYGMGFMPGNVFVTPDGVEQQHNSFDYLPPETYRDAHHDWYSTTGDQLCYLAHGNDKEFEAMVNTVYERMIPAIDANPDANATTFTQEDVSSQCSCDACLAYQEKYKTNAASIIKFCNALNKKVQAHLAEQAEAAGTPKRDFNIIFFAYQRSETPPAKFEDGVWKPIDENVVCDENVGVYIAPIYASYNQSFYSAYNEASATAIAGWTACCQKLYMWLYETNFHYYFLPFNSYESIIETYRYCKNMGAIYVWNEGQYDNGNATHFSKLKEYINAKAEFDVNVNYKDVVDNFFANYFGAANDPMRLFFDELQAHLHWLDKAYPADFKGFIFDEVEQARFWPKKTLDHWLALCDEAYAAIESVKATDPERYEALKRNILLETLFPRYALIQLYPGNYSASALNAMKQQFKVDAQSLGVSRVREYHSIDELYSAWGV